MVWRLEPKAAWIGDRLSYILNPGCIHPCPVCVCVCVCVCKSACAQVCVGMCSDACRGQKRALHILELGLCILVVGSMMWVLGTKFRSSARAAN